MFSPAILNLLDRPYLDLLYSFKDRFPKEKQGDRFTIDFLLKYIYKLDIDTVIDELDLVKALLHIHYGNLRIPDPFMERLEYLFNERKIACPHPIKLLLTNKESFTVFRLKIKKTAKEIDSFLIGAQETSSRGKEMRDALRAKNLLAFEDIREEYEEKFIKK